MSYKLYHEEDHAILSRLESGETVDNVMSDLISRYKVSGVAVRNRLKSLGVDIVDRRRGDYLREANRLASEQNGTCIGVGKKGNKTAFWFKCSQENHPAWLSLIANIRYGKWCRKCRTEENAPKLVKHSIESLRALVVKRNGTLIDAPEHLSSKQRVAVRCENGHTFKIRIGKLDIGQWCGYCRKYLSVGEEIARAHMEYFFGEMFLTTRPSWLNGMELDGYCESLQIAFEYDGLQHFQKVFRQSLAAQQERDILKNKLCLEHGVRLIRVQYSVPFEDIGTHVLSEIRALGIEPSRFDVLPFQSLQLRTNKLAELKTVAQSRGGDCLSTSFFGKKHKYRWKCSKNHEWNAPAQRILSGGWCRQCYFNSRKDVKLTV